MVMAIVTFFFMVGSLRINIVFFLVFLFIDLAFIMLMATYWLLAEGRTMLAGKFQEVSLQSSYLITRVKRFNTEITGGGSIYLHILCLWLVSICWYGTPSSRLSPLTTDW